MQLSHLVLAIPVAAAGQVRSTPFGHRPSSCVFQAPNGASVRSGDGHFVVETPGSLPQTVEVPLECHEFEAERLEAQAESSSAVPDGWLSNAGFYYTPYSSPPLEMRKFTGQWTVPPAPAVPHEPESVYYFIGLEDRTQGQQTSILQPVLTWGDETEGGIGGWHLWSWDCCPQNVTWHSEDINGFQPGDTIYGSIEKVADATWRVDGAFKDSNGAWKNTTLLSEVGNYVFNYADVTLEVYNISSCDQMPAGGADFTELSIDLSDGNSYTPPTWYASGSSSGCLATTKIHDQHTITVSTNVRLTDQSVHV